MVKPILVSLMLMLSGLINAQTGGGHVYEFVTIPVSARAGALGGSGIAINDADLSLANQNPSFFSAQTHNKFTMDYLNYLADINLGYTSYAFYKPGLGSFGAGIQYLNGGEFVYADEDGNTSNNFSASEMAFNLSYARQFDSVFAIGATVKTVYSHLESYQSVGLLMDIGLNYTSHNRLFTAAVVLKNMGSQLTAYNGNYESVPFEIEAGFSTKLEHAPFRFSVVAQQLQSPDLTYSQSNYVNLYNKEQEYPETESTAWTEKVVQHFIFGVEFLPTKNFFVRGGLNMLRRNELKLAEKPGSAGFSWGFGFRISKFHFSYANARYNNAGISNQFSVTTNFSDFLKP